MKNPQALLIRERRLKLTAVVLILIGCLAVLLLVENMLASFVLAFVIYYLIVPIVDFFERRGMNRNLAILIPFFSSGLLLALGIYMILPLVNEQASALEASIPLYQKNMVDLVNSTESRLQRFFSFHESALSTQLNAWLLNKTGEISVALPSAISRSLTVMMLAPFFAFFMLQDGRRLSRTLLALVPNSYFELFMNLHHQIGSQMGNFVRARFLEAALVGAVVWLGLQVISFPYATLLAIFAALTNLIPYIGPIIGAVPPVLIALISNDTVIQDSTNLTLLIVISIYFLAQLLDVIFIIPLVVAKIVNLHPVTVIISIIVGAQLMGILGMIISIPFASALKLTFTTLYNHLIEFRG